MDKRCHWLLTDCLVKDYKNDAEINFDTCMYFMAKINPWVLKTMKMTVYINISGLKTAYHCQRKQ